MKYGIKYIKSSIARRHMAAYSEKFVAVELNSGKTQNIKSYKNCKKIVQI